jgi:hypothetical protein
MDGPKISATPKYNPVNPTGIHAELEIFKATSLTFDPDAKAPAKHIALPNHPASAVVRAPGPVLPPPTRRDPHQQAAGAWDCAERDAIFGKLKETPSSEKSSATTSDTALTLPGCGRMVGAILSRQPGL